MKLSISILSSKKSYKDVLNELEEYLIDFLHIDSINNLGVFDDIDYIKRNSSIPLDLHIISDNIDKYIPFIEKYKIERVSIQCEALINLDIPKFIDTQVGLAITINNENLFNILEKYNDKIDFALIMCTTPGISGGIFTNNYFDIIQKIISKYPNLKLQIDGGVNNEIAYILRLFGVESIVVGSYLMNHNSLSKAIMELRSKKVQSDILIKDFMLKNDLIPKVFIDDDFDIVINTIEKYNIGITTVLNNDNTFVGIITNADIRKKMIAKEDIYKLKAVDIVNKNPIIAKEDNSVKELFKIIENNNIPILILPVIDNLNILKGLVSFHKLLKSTE